MHLIYLICSFNFYRVGLSSTRFLNAGHVAKGEASDRMERGSSRVDRVSSWSIRSHHNTRFKERYNDRDLIARGASESFDRDPTAPI